MPTVLMSATRCALLALILGWTTHCIGREAESGCAPMIVYNGFSPNRQPIEASEKVEEPVVPVRQEGRYCLGSNLRLQPRPTGVGIGRMPSDPSFEIVTLSADDIEINLQKHSISNNWYPAGITLFRYFNYEGSSFGRGRGFLRTTIREGKLSSPGDRGVALDLLSTEYPLVRGTKIAKLPEGATADQHFRETNHLIESLDIRSGEAGILVEGKGNVIRNNKIIIDGDRALLSRGPKLVLENNEIEIKGALTDEGRIYGRSLPIQLIQADGAIIRNNRIRFTGSGRDFRPEAAFDLIESRDVLFENNEVVGIPALERRDASSTVRPAEPTNPPSQMPASPRTPGRN